MTTKPYSLKIIACLSFIITAIVGLSSCQKDFKKSTDPVPSNISPKVSGASYNWGELAINKKTQSDIISYNSATGNIDSVVTFDETGTRINDIAFTYTPNKITLNTKFHDEYDLDNSGRVVYHSSAEIQQGHNIVEIERYAYDVSGYLHKVTMSLTFDGNISPVYSTIDYEVTNGNYTSYTLSNTDSGTVTRQYIFSYDITKKVNSPCAFFAPIFANDTNSDIDKYLNYGKPSVNLLKSLTYKLENLDKSISTGSFNVFTTLNADGTITSLSLQGDDIEGFPSDNLSPIPRSITLTLKK